MLINLDTAWPCIDKDRLCLGMLNQRQANSIHKPMAITRHRILPHYKLASVHLAAQIAILLLCGDGARPLVLEL